MPCPKTTPRDSYYGGFADEASGDIYDTDYVVAFTLSPDPNRYPTNDPGDQYRILMPYIFKGIKNIFSTFCFTPELTQNGNIHIHGWYVVLDKIKYFKYWLPKVKQLGRTDIQKMGKGWLDYCKKDMELMAEVVYPYPVPLTHVNYDVYKKCFMPKKSLKKKVLKSKHWCDITKYINKK